MEKPRVKFCWKCGRKLQGNHHEMLVVHGHERILHKFCAKVQKKEMDKKKATVQRICDYADSLDW